MPRESDTACHSGVRTATTCSSSGSWLMGKNVPLKMNMGMITKRKSVAKGASLVCAAEKAWMGAAKARPVSIATGSISSAWGRSVAPKTTITPEEDDRAEGHAHARPQQLAGGHVPRIER